MKLEKHKFLFIINPHSGLKIFKNLEQKIYKTLINTNIEPDLIKTKYAGHAKEIAKKAVEKPTEYSAIIAVGGDGTINEIVSAIGLSKMPFGIIPTGSGNGFARHLGISMLPMKALKTIIDFYCEPIDLIKIGKSRYGANVAGVGFDALISWRFKDSKIRGPISYAKIILEEILSYQPKKYTIEFDDNCIEVESPMITIANSSQFGNNARIAPTASVKDGYLNLCIIKPFPKTISLDIAGKIMTGQIHNSKYYEHYLVKKITIKQDKAEYQIDGDFIKKKKKINIKIKESALNVIIPKKSINKI